MATELTDIALAAVEAGWQQEEVVVALVDLADHMMLGMIANRDIDQDIAFLRKR